MRDRWIFLARICKNLLAMTAKGFFSVSIVADLQRNLQKQSSPEVFDTEHVFGNFAKCTWKNL